eukprot:484464-Hanusia_phi.AAC.1
MADPVAGWHCQWTDGAAAAQYGNVRPTTTCTSLRSMPTTACMATSVASVTVGPPRRCSMHLALEGSTKLCTVTVTVGQSSPLGRHRQ